MIVFRIHSSFFIVLPIRLKTYILYFYILYYIYYIYIFLYNIIFFVFYKAKCARPKNRALIRDFAGPNVPDRHWARNLSMPDLRTSEFVYV